MLNSLYVIELEVRRNLKIQITHIIIKVKKRLRIFKKFCKKICFLIFYSIVNIKLRIKTKLDRNQYSTEQSKY